jgi:hypothetical protein
MCPEMDNTIHDAAASGIAWLKKQRLVTVKDISRSIQALHMWGEPPSDMIDILLLMKKNGSWETETPLTDTARACSALVSCGFKQLDSVLWIQDQQENDCWNNNEIDTAYALIALGDCGVQNKSGCEWLIRNYGEKWEYAGTTALIISALIKQDRTKYRDFIKNRTEWLLSERRSWGLTHIATSNLVIQALILADGKEIKGDILHSIQWLLENQEKGTWGNITSTALSLISLGMYEGLIHRKDEIFN